MIISNEYSYENLIYNMICTWLSQLYVVYFTTMSLCDRTHSGILQIKIEECWNFVINQSCTSCSYLALLIYLILYHEYMIYLYNAFSTVGSMLLHTYCNLSHIYHLILQFNFRDFFDVIHQLACLDWRIEAFDASI